MGVTHDNPSEIARPNWLGWLAPVILLAVSTAELLLADRKYGVFSGGFGQSRSLDRASDIGWFVAGYVAAQAVLGLSGWWLAARIARRQPAWVAVFAFALVAALFLALLAAQYQLHAYFSDAVSFALLAQLGGGSLVDALLFGLSEIGAAALALGLLLAAALLAWWLAWRMLPPMRSPARFPVRWPLAALIAAAALTFAVTRSGTDAPYGLARTLAWSGLAGTLDLVSDVDRDGYGLFAVQYDRAPWDSARHPLARDIPGNGVDEDGYGGDLTLVRLNSPLPAQIIAGRSPHLVIVVIESLRGDALGMQIGGRPVAPHLEAMAASGDVARATYSHVGFTTESLKSLFSGQIAPQPGDPSLFRDLHAGGYRIGVFSGQSENFGDISATVGMRKSADVFFDAETLRDKRAFSFAAKGSLLVDEEHLLSAFKQRMGGNWSRPHFLYFNFQSAHFPYWHDAMGKRVTGSPLPRDGLVAANAGAVAETYWNAVAHADAALGKLVEELKRQGVWDKTLLIVTGDHGEDLFEDGFLGHGHIINQRQYRTVAVANRPGVFPVQPIGLSDVRAIIMAALAGAAPPEPTASPFLHIGPLESPTAIGLVGPAASLTSLRLDTGLACFVEENRCEPYQALGRADRARADALIARWGSERWRMHRRQEHEGRER